MSAFAGASELLLAPPPPDRPAPRLRELSVVIPAYNEERRVASTIHALDRYLAGRYRAELLLVNDGSRDGTLRVARALQLQVPSLRVISFPQNHGKGFAVRAGVLEAAYEAVLFTDADLSTPIEEIERFWPSYDRGASVVIASRHHPGSKGRVQQRPARRLMGKVFNFLMSIAGLRGIRDTQCGFKLFRRDVAVDLFSRLQTPGFAFDVEILMRARARRKRVDEIPVRWIEAAGSHVRPFRDSIRMLRDVVRLRGRI